MGGNTNFLRMFVYKNHTVGKLSFTNWTDNLGIFFSEIKSDKW